MGKARSAGFFVGAVLACCGCNNQDAERLARVGRVLVAKWEAATGASNDKLISGWQKVRGELDETALLPRVTARLRWDKALADSQIEVHAHDGQVELKGTVRDLAQRRRAVELAQSTVGAEKIIDLLEVSESK